MDFEFNEEQKIIQDTAAKFAKRELEPIAAYLDQTKDREKLKDDEDAKRRKQQQVAQPSFLDSAQSPAREKGRTYSRGTRLGD